MQYVLKIQPIRPATEQDIPAIAALYDRITEREAKGTNYSGWAQGEYPMEWTARELLEAGGLYCMTDQSGKVIASAAYDNRHDSCYDDVVWGKDIPSEQTLCIYTLAIDPDYRGQGLGEAMMRFGFEMAEKLGLKGIRIDTWVENTPALKLYHKLGYRDVAVLSDNVHYEGDRMAYQFLEWYR
jgi:ribosomal protein S18 acetylase RimI-like enzyme